MANDPADFPLPRHQTAAMALILVQVARGGYAWHATQTAPEDRILAALAKLHEKHRILSSPLGRHARREAGLPVAYLVLGPEPRGGEWPAALLATRKLPGEAMHRVTDPRHPLTWPAWRGGKWEATYVLRFDDDRQRWTWYLHESFHRELLEEALRHTLAGDWPRLVGHLKAMGDLPAFHGIWAQIHDILRRTQKLWGDRHLRTPGGLWREPPWKKAIEDWPRRPLPVAVRIWQEDPPRTVGEWLEMRAERSL